MVPATVVPPFNFRPEKPYDEKNEIKRCSLQRHDLKLNTKPQIYPKSLLEIFLVSGFPADAVSSSSSSALKPTRAMPLSTPIVAGIAPFWRTRDSRLVANAALSGYGNPEKLSGRNQPNIHFLPCVVYRGYKW